MVGGLKPVFDTTVQYVVELSPFFLEYLEAQSLDLELNAAQGWDYTAIGVARLPLKQVRCRWWLHFSALNVNAGPRVEAPACDFGGKRDHQRDN